MQDLEMVVVEVEEVEVLRHSRQSCLLLPVCFYPFCSHKKGKLCTMRERRVNAEVDEGIEDRISGL